MATEITRICDICRKATPRIAGKFFYVPIVGDKKYAVHSKYSHHLDVGECCADKLLGTEHRAGLFNFHKRVIRKVKK